MEFNLHHLRVFSAVARYENYTQAANELYLSQPAISSQIASLEKFLGFELFTRYGRGVILTAEGQVFYKQAQKLLEKFDDVKMVVDEIKELSRGSVRLAATTTAGIYLVPSLLGEFHRRYPNIELSLDINNRLQVERLVLNYQADLAVMGMVEHPENLTIEPFHTNELVVVASAHHPLGESVKEVTFSELAENPFLIREPGSGTRLDVERVIAEQQVNFKSIIELGSIEAIKRGVAVGLGITVLPRPAIEIEMAAGNLTILPVKGFPIRRQWYIAYRPGRLFSNAAEALKDYLRSLRKP